MSYKDNMRSKVNKIRKRIQEKRSLVKSPGEGEMQPGFKGDTSGGASLTLVWDQVMKMLETQVRIN